MYGDPPDTIPWEDTEADETALFHDVEDEYDEYGRARTPRWRPSGFVEWFAVGQTLLPALLFLPGSQAYRLPIRTGAYAVSLCAFVVWWFDRGGQGRGKHPAAGWIMLTLLWLGLMMLHPETAPLAGVAQICLYFAILCPVFWAPRVCLQPAAADAGARRAARLQRHQLDGRRHAGVQPGPLDAASALVGVLTGRRRCGPGGVDVCWLERPPHDPPPRPVRCGRRRGWRRHGRHDSWPHLLPGTDRLVETVGGSWICAGRHVRALSQPRARCVRHDSGDDGRVSRAARRPESEETRDWVRRAGNRSGGRRPVGRDSAGWRFRGRAVSDAARRRPTSSCTTRAAASRWNPR